MEQIHLYLNFPKNELLHFKLFYFLFRQTLQNTQKFAFFVPSQENISISSFPNFLDHLEIFYSYLSSWNLLYFMKFRYVWYRHHICRWIVIIPFSKFYFVWFAFLLFLFTRLIWAFFINRLQIIILQFYIFLFWIILLLLFCLVHTSHVYPSV